MQREFNSYDQKKLKRMRHVLQRDPLKLSEKDQWYLNRYLNKELREAYELKEIYKKWQNESIYEKDFLKEKEGLFAFYRTVEKKQNPPFY